MADTTEVAPPRRALQCKDIPDLPILELMNRQAEIALSQGKDLFYAQWCIFGGDDPSTDVYSAMPGWANYKLARAKMGQLLKRGLCTGCACGCRGDFTITEKGRAVLLAAN